MAPKLSELVNNCNVDVGSHYPTWRTGYIPWAFWSVTRSCLVFILIYHACHGTYMGWAQANLFDCCMDTVTTTILGGFCSYLFYHFLDNILHDMAWILFAAYWRRLREIALQGFNGGTQERMGLRTFGALDVINRPLAKHNASEDKQEKSRKKDQVRQNYGFIYRGGIIVSIIFSSWIACIMIQWLVGDILLFFIILSFILPSLMFVISAGIVIYVLFFYRRWWYDTGSSYLA